MPTYELFARRDPLWVASMRARYAAMVRRHATGGVIPGDEQRLDEALGVLSLSGQHFESDVAELRASGLPDRVAGVWPEDPGVNIQVIDESETESVSVTL